MDPLEALAASGGVARYAALRRRGVSDAALAKAVVAGTLLRLDGAGYALPETPAGLVAAVRCGGVASHSTAARLHGLATWMLTDDLHVTVPRGSRPRIDGVIVHRCNLQHDDVDPQRPLTAPFRTLLDCGRALPLLEAVVVLDSALRLRRVRVSTLRAAAEAARGHGSVALRQAVAYVDALNGSPLESVLRMLVRLTSAQVTTQVVIPGVARIDIVLDGWLVVEADGFEFHSKRDDYRRDRRRANRLAERGYVLLRFTWEDLRLRPWSVLAEIERVRAAGPRSTPSI